MTEPTRDVHGRTHESIEHTLHTYRKAWEQEKQRAAELEAEVERLRAENEKMLAAINWACGAGDSDFEEPANANRYWWRRKLHDKAGLEYDSGTCLFRPTPRTDG